MTLANLNPDIDLDARGRHVGRLLIPHSRDEDAWGAIHVPVVSIKGGPGPRVLLLAGIHGDEYEGPIIAAELIRALDGDGLTGQLIIVPTANRAAVAAGRRTAPEDGRDLARAFPGDPRGGPTDKIAAAIAGALYPRVDIVVDLHAGGSGMRMVPCALAAIGADSGPTARETVLGMARAAGLPLTVVSEIAPDSGSTIGEAARRGLPALALELGEGGWVTTASLDRGRAAVLRLLRHVGLRTGPTAVPPPPASLLVRPGARLHAPSDGWFERGIELGAAAEAGAIAGYWYDLARPFEAPMAVQFTAAGIVQAHMIRARATAGALVAALVDPLEASP